MTPRQIELSRHALGLDGTRRVSYRNRFVAGPGHTDHAAWMGMVAEGTAERMDGSTLPPGRRFAGGADLFWLTTAGAKAALQPGERLDPEDFPQET